MSAGFPSRENALRFRELDNVRVVQVTLKNHEQCGGGSLLFTPLALASGS